MTKASVWLRLWCSTTTGNTALVSFLILTDHQFFEWDSYCGPIWYFVEIRIARIFNTYGPRMNIDDGRVVSNFIAQALRGEALTVQKPGTQTRSFCYVSDMVDGLIRLMEGDDTGPINIGNPGLASSFQHLNLKRFYLSAYVCISLCLRWIHNGGTGWNG